jgi:beta-lactamase class A
MSRKNARSRGWQAVIGAMVTVLLLVAVVIVASQKLHGSAHPAAQSTLTPVTSSAPSTPASTPAPTTRPASRPSTPRRKPATTPRAIVDATMRRLSAQLPAGGVSVGVVDTNTGARYSFGATGGMRTGSVYKLLVLETLLLQHQDEGTQLDDGEMSLAAPMIESSDNKAAYQLFLDIGGNDGLRTGAHRLGMTHTIPGQADPALTTSSAADGLTLVKNLVSQHPLSQYSRSVALGLLHNLESDQRWGVGAVADRGTTFANKNGWLQVDNSNGPDEDDDSRWLVNSVGIVTVHRQQVLMAVFTQHGDSLDDGIDLVESLAKVLAPAVVAH